MSTILWDFDNTLFQTRAFWRAKLFPAYEPMGIPAETVAEAFKEATSVSYDYFVPDAVLSALSKRAGRSKEELAPTLENIVYTDMGKPYFFPHALSAVAHGKEKGYAHYLLSYGDEAFKTKWFLALGLSALFSPEETVISNKKKPELLRNLSLSGEVIVVNDVLAETEAMSEALQREGVQVRAYHFSPEPATVPASSHTVFSDFAELSSYL